MITNRYATNFLKGNKANKDAGLKKAALKHKLGTTSVLCWGIRRRS